MKKIQLSRGYEALVDDDDYDRISKYTWAITTTLNHKYATRYANINGRRTRVSMHREILGLHGEKILVDHIDRDGLNNQKCNLRLCAHRQNSMNRISSRGTSKYKGVSWNSLRKKWRAVIGYKGYVKHLGFFDSEEEAAKKYNKEAANVFGEFALLNKIIFIIFLMFPLFSYGQNKTVINIGEGSGAGSATCVCDTLVWVKVLGSNQDYTTTTFSAVSGLTLNVEAGKSYSFTTGILFDTIPAGGYKLTMDGTAGYSSYFATTSAGVGRMDFGVIVDYTNGINNYNHAVVIHGSLTVSSSGTFGVQAAQYDSDGGTTTMLPGSFIELKLSQ